MSNTTSEHQPTGVILTDEKREQVNTLRRASYRKKKEEDTVKLQDEKSEFPYDVCTIWIRSPRPYLIEISFRTIQDTIRVPWPSICAKSVPVMPSSAHQTLIDSVMVQPFPKYSVFTTPSISLLLYILDKLLEPMHAN